MKLGFLFFSLFLLTVSTGCDKSKHRMKVIKDCTGVYLRTQNGRDFNVCNAYLLDDVESGTTVKVTYENLNQCYGITPQAVCYMQHVFEGNIEIKEIY